MKNKISLIMFIPLFLFFISCSQNEAPVSEVSPGVTEVSESADFIKYVSSHTVGLISRSDSLSVSFTTPVLKDSSPESLNALVSLTPSADVSVKKTDDYSLEIIPETLLHSGQQYKAEVNLKKLFTDISEEEAHFSFACSVIKQDMELVAGELEQDAGNEESFILKGHIQTADRAEAAKIEKSLAFSDKNAVLTWNHAQGNRHEFTISNIIPGITERKEVLSWTGEHLALADKDTHTFRVPSENVFRFLSFRSKPSGAVSVWFSKPLDRGQNTEGLVRVNHRELGSLVIEGNRLDLYPAGGSTGDDVFEISSSLKDTEGKSLGKACIFTLPRQFAKPKVKMINSGGILPDSEGTTIAFEAVSLKAVDVSVIRIHEHNLIQFLQNNRDVKGHNEIKKVGRPVYTGTVSLEGRGVDNLYEPGVFQLDLNDLISGKKGALYEVKISFRRSQSLYPCETFHDDEGKNAFADENYDAPKEGSYWNYYGNGYVWRERNDPCSLSYYYNKSVKMNIISSNLGLIVKASDSSEMIIYVTDLLNAGPARGAEVTVYDYQQNSVGSGISNSEGFVSVKPTGRPFAVKAVRDEQISLLRVDDSMALTVSDFDVSGQFSRRGIKGFLYGERGVWRPGDEIHLSFILEDRKHSLPADTPLVLELRDPSGKQVQKQVIPRGGGPLYSFLLKTDPEAPTGNWKAEVFAGGERFSKTLKIETVKPNRLKVDLDFGVDKIDVSDEGSGSGTLTSTWLHGAVAKNLKARIEMQVEAVPTVFGNWRPYTFDDPSRSFRAESRRFFDGYLDDKGRADIPLVLENREKSPGFLKLKFNTRVFEDSGNFSIGSDSLLYSPYTSYVGMKTPDGDAARGMLLTDEDHIVDIATVDGDGNPVSRESLDVEMYKLSWKWWWDTTHESLDQFISRSHSRVLLRETVSTSGGKGQWTFQRKYPEWGRYLIRISDPVSGHSCGKIVYLDWPGWAGSPQRGDSGAQMLSFYSDKKAYLSDETARVSVPTAAGGRLLVSLENGSDVINSWWVDTVDNLTTFSFPVEAGMAPTVYVHISYIQPHENTANDYPVRMYGVIPLDVTDPSSRLEPVLSMPDVLEPEGTFSVTVHEKSGKPMSYTLAVVDDGLLDLTQFRTPDPLSHFKAREALGVKTWDVYEDVMGAMGQKFGTLLGIGGDGSEEKAPVKNANRFKPVVRFLGPFSLPSGGRTTHKVTLPLYVGSVRTMVVAAGDGSYGHTEKTTPVKKDLMILGTLPRVLRPGEEIDIPVNVFSLSQSPQDVTVSLNSTELLSVTGPAEKKVHFSEAGDTFVYFRGRVQNTLGTVSLEMNARSGKDSVSDRVDLQILPANPAVTKSSQHTLEPGESLSLSMSRFGYDQTFSRMMEVSVMPSLNLEKRLDYLIRYPYGCIEQTISSVFPQIFLPALYPSDVSLLPDIQKNVQAAIERLNLFQMGDGGFSYWPGQGEVSEWGTSYAGHFLKEAELKGYHVSPEMTDKWKSRQIAAASRWNPRDGGHSDQAYRLFTLANWDMPQWGAMNRLKEELSSKDPSLVFLAAAYARSGEENTAGELLTALTLNDEFLPPDASSFRSVQQIRAMELYVLKMLGRQAQARRVLEQISGWLGSDTWLSTQSTAFALWSAAFYAGDLKEESMALSWSLGSSSSRIKDKARLTLRPLPDDNGTLTLTSGSDRTLFVNIIEKGIPLEGESAEGSRNLSLDVSFIPKSDNTVLDYTHIESGTDFIAEFRVKNQTGILQQHMALTQIMPSGWEILNTRFTGEAFYGGSETTYRDIRDDRVSLFFSLKPYEEKTFRVLLNAAYRGHYYLPATSCSHMYSSDVYAHKDGRRVEVD